MPQKSKHVSKDDLHSLVEDLQIHQIELEMQNEELQRTQSALQDSQAKYLDLYEFAPVGYLSVDSEHFVRDANLTSGILLNCSRNNILDHNMLVFVEPNFRPMFIQHIKKTFATNQTESCELQLHRSPEQAVWCRLDSKVIECNPHISQARIIVTEISKTKEAELKLTTLKEELEQRVLNRTKTLLRYQEQLRSLASQVTLSEKRERRQLCVELHDYLAQMLVASRIKLTKAKDSSSDLMLPLLNEIDEILHQSLEYTRNLIAQLSPIMLYEFGLCKALQWLADQMRQYDLHVDVLILDHDFQLDENESVLMYHAVRELLLNVVKHANTDQASIEVHVTTDQELIVTVCDQGSGFDLAILDPSHTSAPEHFGLFSIQERLEGMWGRLELKSASGLGCTATLALPLATKQRPDRKSDDIGEIEPHPPQSTRRKESLIRVLLVDDHAMVREGLRTLIESHHLLEVVAVAGNGQEAIEQARQFQPKVVVMDVNMPVMNGIEATRRIKQAWPSISVIGLSMQDESQVRESMKAAGASNLLTKSGPVDNLLNTILQTVDSA
ncbi:response regulator [Candidatus Nitrospira salsa]